MKTYAFLSVISLILLSYNYRELPGFSHHGYRKKRAGSVIPSTGSEEVYDIPISNREIIFAYLCAFMMGFSLTGLILKAFSIPVQVIAIAGICGVITSVSYVELINKIIDHSSNTYKRKRLD